MSRKKKNPLIDEPEVTEKLYTIRVGKIPHKVK